jgi:hypothetical protein
MFKCNREDRWKSQCKTKEPPIEKLKAVKDFKEKKKKKLPKESEMFDLNYVEGGKIAVGKKVKKKPEENFFAIRKSCVSRTCKHGVKV